MKMEEMVNIWVLTSYSFYFENLEAYMRQSQWSG